MSALTGEWAVSYTHLHMVSINSCVAVDLYGQVAAESSGVRQISGTGGQLDFLIGASASRGGKAFICMSSVYAVSYTHLDVYKRQQ